jgi:4a-hydroxytetrahydrobiopterin dehydratase
MSDDLTRKSCIPCRGDVPPLRGAELEDLHRRLGGDWKVVREHHLSKEFAFPDFREALEFTNQVGETAEREGHHPDVYLAWGKVRLDIWTHKIDGLTESDFILAAKSDALYRGD